MPSGLHQRWLHTEGADMVGAMNGCSPTLLHHTQGGYSSTLLHCRRRQVLPHPIALSAQVGRCSPTLSQHMHGTVLYLQLPEGSSVAPGHVGALGCWLPQHFRLSCCPLHPGLWAWVKQQKSGEVD